MIHKINVIGSCVSRISLLDGQRELHGVVGDDLALGYYLDKQNLALAMMPAPFSDAEVETVEAKELYDPSRIRTLKQCLNKKTIPMLMDSDAEYLVMDLYDFHNDFAFCGNTAFSTCAHEVFNTALYRKYQNYVGISNFMKMPTWMWYPYVDLFFEKVMQKYDADHIILLCFRSNTYYWGTDGKIKEIPDAFKQPYHSNDKYNVYLKHLEEYIIRKYQPYVIDLSKFYMANQFEWDNLNGAHFETGFYHDAYAAITEIVRGTAKKRTYSTPSFLGENFGKATPGMENFTLDVEGVLELLPQLVEKEDILWLNILHKLNVYAPEDERVKAYTAMCVGEQ